MYFTVCWSSLPCSGFTEGYCTRCSLTHKRHFSFTLLVLCAITILHPLPMNGFHIFTRCWVTAGLAVLTAAALWVSAFCQLGSVHYGHHLHSSFTTIKIIQLLLTAILILSQIRFHCGLTGRDMAPYLAGSVEMTPVTYILSKVFWSSLWTKKGKYVYFLMKTVLILNPHVTSTFLAEIQTAGINCRALKLHFTRPH